LQLAKEFNPDFTADKCTKLLRKMDTNHDGKVSKAEFLTFWDTSFQQKPVSADEFASRFASLLSNAKAHFSQGSQAQHSHHFAHQRHSNGARRAAGKHTSASVSASASPQVSAAETLASLRSFAALAPYAAQCSRCLDLSGGSGSGGRAHG
jgi:hypothetical protein